MSYIYLFIFILSSHSSSRLQVYTNEYWLLQLTYKNARKKKERIGAVNPHQRTETKKTGLTLKICRRRSSLWVYIGDNESEMRHCRLCVWIWDIETLSHFFILMEFYFSPGKQQIPKRKKSLLHLNIIKALKPFHILAPPSAIAAQST